MSVQRSTRVRRALLLSVALHVAVLVPWWALRGAHEAPEPSVELRFVWLDERAEAQPTPDAKVIAAADTQADQPTQAPVTAELDQAPSVASRASAARRATALPQPTEGEERAQPLPTSPIAKRDGVPQAPNGALAMAQAQDVRAPRPAGRPHFEARPDQDVQETAADPWAASAASAASSEQAVVDLRRSDRRSAVDRRDDPLGRHSQAVYRALRRRWRRDRLQPIAIPQAVVVSFTIGLDGRVSGAAVAVSSGDPVLDAVARAAVPDHVAPLPQLAHVSSVKHQVTFRYQPG